MCKRVLASQTSENGDVPFYKIGTIGGVPNAYISKEIFDEYKKKYNYPRQGELLITCAGTVGKCLIFDGKDAYFQDSNIVWIDNPKYKISNKFLFYFISQVNWSKLNSTTITRIYNDDLRALAIKFPSIQEQEKISQFLNLLNDRIATQSKIIEKLKSLMKTLNEGLFCKTKSAIPNLRFSEFTEEWKNMTIQEVLKIGNGRDYKHLNEGNIPVFGTGGYMTSVDDYLHNGQSVCIGRKGTINKPFFLSGKFWTVDTLFYTHSFKEALPKFCFYIFNQINWLEYNEASGVPSLSKTTIEKINIIIPSILEQEKITSFLSLISDKIEMEISIILNYKKQKKYLLHNMFI